MLRRTLCKSMSLNTKIVHLESIGTYYQQYQFKIELNFQGADVDPSLLFPGHLAAWHPVKNSKWQRPEAGVRRHAAVSCSGRATPPYRDRPPQGTHADRPALAAQPQLAASGKSRQRRRMKHAQQRMHRPWQAEGRC